MNVDGRGSRCIYWYRRPKHEAQRIRLAKPRCSIDPRRLYPVLNKLVKLGLIKRKELYMRDELSVWGMDRYILYYVSEDQISRRLKIAPLTQYF